MYIHACIYRYLYIIIAFSILVDLSSKLHAKEDSILEVDITNETVRLKEGWEMWLMPNSIGGRLCSLLMPYRLGSCVLRRTYKEDETLFHVVILSKHYHHILIKTYYCYYYYYY
jgi:hypothetical protein